ncbi:Schwann cell myelin protein-like isoform X1 [Ranitomeya variabilis]|uniref:Schwann cell myelin protein-like isoform X1 n=1 Tax=Ranitomeya variabilis TaxID=490064 RepID=UPI0040573D8D
MDPMKQIYLLLIYQGFYLGSVCQRWTFPEIITALIGSCVEIPCTYHPAGRSGSSSAVWYLSIPGSRTEILNTKNSSSSIGISYKGRTSLVPGDNSCTLRIDPVRREDGDKYYYPGIAEDITINAADKQSIRYVYLSVTDEADVRLDLSNRLTEGEPTTILCSVDHTCRSSPPSLQWNKPGQIQNQSEISDGSWSEQSSLTYIASYVDDGTPVRCTATYHNGQSFHESGTLNIKYTPKNVTVVVGKDKVVEGSDVTLQCSSFSKSDVFEYEWYKGKDKTKLPDRGWEITVRNVTRDEEPYSCAAINHVGRGESALTEILVLYAAIGVQITVKNEGEFTKLTCDFRGSRPDVTHYTWKKDGSILHNETGKILTIYNNVDSYGQYSCIAHNSVGDSSSSEIYHEDKILYSPVIWGSVAGALFLLLFIVFLCLCLRRKKKSSSIHETLTKISNENDMAKDDNHHGNIQSSHNGLPPPARSEPSFDISFAGNQVIYSNSEMTQPSTEVEYSVISHRQPNQAGQNSSRARHDDDVEYATLKK